MATSNAGSSSGGPQLPLPGDLLLTEAFIANTSNETTWLEFVNTSAHAVTLNGLTLAHPTAPEVGALPNVTVAPGTYVVVAADAALATMDGVTADGVWDAFALVRTNDGVEVRNGATAITGISWSDSAPAEVRFPVPGSSLQLDMERPFIHSDPRRWCSTLSSYGPHSNKGTPGAINPTCPIRYAIVPGINFECANAAFHLQADNIQILRHTPSLLVMGIDNPLDPAITILSQTPAPPQGTAFSAAASVLGGCREDYVLTGTLAPAWTGNFALSFTGPQCQDCTSYSTPVTGFEPLTSGNFALQSTIAYSCAALSLNLMSFMLDDTGGKTLTLSGSDSAVPPLTVSPLPLGAAYVVSGSKTVGSCVETFSMQITGTSNAQLTAALNVSFAGQCGACATQNVSVAGTRF